MMRGRNKIRDMKNNEPVVIIPLSEYNLLKKYQDGERKMKPFINYGFGETWYENVEYFDADVQRMLQENVDSVQYMSNKLRDIENRWWFKIFASKRLKK